MIALQIARIIADYIIFLDLSDDDILDPDVAVKMMEAIGPELEALEPAFLRQLIDAFQVIAPEYSGPAHDIVRNMAREFHLEEALAADDPVKLAELQARREAVKG